MPSHSSPRVLAKIASMPPRSLAWARATTFSAYDVVFRPAAVALRSLRVHGTTTTFACAGGSGCGPAVTM